MLTTRQEPEGFKKWEDLAISDDFIFTPIMRNKRLCRTLLEMILKVRVGEIHFLQRLLVQGLEAELRHLHLQV